MWIAWVAQLAWGLTLGFASSGDLGVLALSAAWDSLSSSPAPLLCSFSLSKKRKEKDVHVFWQFQLSCMYF